MKKPIVMLTTAVLATALAMPAFAADQAFTADAQLRADFSIVMDGNDVDFKTSSGNAVYPILIQFLLIGIILTLAEKIFAYRNVLTLPLLWMARNASFMLQTALV